jgi:hypothetical protein
MHKRAKKVGALIYQEDGMANAIKIIKDLDT